MQPLKENGKPLDLQQVKRKQEVACHRAEIQVETNLSLIGSTQDLEKESVFGPFMIKDIAAGLNFQIVSFDRSFANKILNMAPSSPLFLGRSCNALEYERIFLESSALVHEIERADGMFSLSCKVFIAYAGFPLYGSICVDILFINSGFLFRSLFSVWTSRHTFSLKGNESAVSFWDGNDSRLRHCYS